MSDVRFGLMILTAKVVMFVLMYWDTYAGEHVVFSEMPLSMAVMAFALTLWLLRRQVTVPGTSDMRA